MKLFGNRNPKNTDSNKKITSSGFDDTAELDVTAVRKAYEAAAAEKKTDVIVKQNKKRRGRTAIIALAVILAIGVAAFAWYKSWSTLPEIDGGLHITPPGSLVSPPVNDPNNPANSDKPKESEGPDVGQTGQREGVYTFLAVGVDQISSSTDTIMVATFDIVEHTIDIVSIPRDTLVSVSWGTKRVNTLHASGGLDGLIDGISDLLGYKINCYAIVDLEAFERLVDAIGGVYYDVPMDMYYDAPDQNLHIAVPKGYQLLDGHDAIGVVRFRSGYATADIGRIGTQQDFLKAVAKQLLQIGNITKINEFAKIFEECVDTNLTLGNIVRFGEEFLKVKEEDINFHIIPANYNGSIRSGSYCLIYVDEWLALINDKLNPLYEDITRSNVDILEWNGSQGVSTTGKVYSYESFTDYSIYLK